MFNLRTNNHKAQSEQFRTSKARSGSEVLLTRIMSGVTYILLVTLCIILGPVPLAICTALISWLSCSELLRLARRLGRRPFEFIALTYAVLMVFLPLFPELVTLIVFSSLLLVAGLAFVFSPQASLADLAVTLLAPLYTGYLLSAIVEIRLMYFAGSFYSTLNSVLLTFFVMASIWASDVFAYFIGARFGKHRMIPSISPNKSWEGFIGSLLGSVVSWLLMVACGIPGITWWFALIAGVVVAIAGIIGDLFESRIKRAAGVKDSGTIMPGHGGMLDRSDSALFGVMVAYFLLRIAGFIL